MDPLDQRLTDAGTAWRQSQTEPPDLNRIVALLDGRRSRAFSPRLAFAFAAGLLLLAAVAVVPGVGGLFRGSNNGLPVPAASSPASTRTPTPTATPTPTPTRSATSKPTPEATPHPSDREQATTLLRKYEDALIQGQWQIAFGMLAPASPTRAAGAAAYAAERAPYFQSVAGRYTIAAPTQPADWTIYAPLIDGADLTRAYLFEVDYPALANNNAGYEQFVVAPDGSGTWRIWPVR